MARDSMDILELLRKRGMDGDVDFLREALAVLVEGIMDAEVSAKAGAGYGDRGGVGGLEFNLVKEVVENSAKLLPEVAFILYYPKPKSSSPKPRRELISEVVEIEKAQVTERAYPPGITNRR